MIMNIPNSRTTGPARQMYYLQEELSLLGHGVDLLFAEDVPRPLGTGSLTPLTFPVLLPFAIGVRRRRYDVVSIHTLGGAVYTWLRRFLKGLPPCVIVSHGNDELRWELEQEEERLGLKPLSWRAQWLYYPLVVRQARYSTRHADHLITMSSAEKAFYVQRRGIPADRVSVIPNGVSKEFFQTRSYSQTNRLLYFGGWEWRKGIRYLVEAFSLASRQAPDLILSIVGTGNATGVLEAFPPDVRHRVRLTPKVSAEAVPAVYSSHDLFVLPTLFESIPLVIPEAMAGGMPIVASHVCGIPDILKHEVSALLVPPRDSQTLASALLSLIKDPSLRMRLGKTAQAEARKITWEKVAAATARCYERLLSEEVHAP